jgi:hypothetical protein
MIDEHADELISQTIDAGAGDATWQEFTSRADAQPRLWQQLAESQRDELSLIRAMAEASVVADAVAAPAITLRAEAAHVAAHVDRSMRIRQWSGWAVAALVTIALFLRTGLPLRNSPVPGTSMTSLGSPVQTAADAFNSYIQKGQESGAVVGEVPAKVLVDTRPAPSGNGYELLYLRQVLERTVVPNLYEVNGQNELGQPTLVRYEQPVRKSM